jgi:hypothetical protein
MAAALAKVTHAEVASGEVIIGQLVMMCMLLLVIHGVLADHR